MAPRSNRLRAKLALRTLGAGVFALTTSVALGQEPANAKVDELVVGPAKQGHQYFVSPRGAHFATLMQKGSRFVVVIDGVEGPKFDDIVASTSNNANIVFSPDGTHCAYVGRSGQEFVVVLDGKEHFRTGSATDTYGSSPVADLAFTPNSRHLWFRQHVHESNETGDNYDCVVFDGVAGLPGGLNPVFGKGGDRFAYVAVNPRDPSQQTVVVDGQPAGYSGTDPMFTGDGEHLIVRTQVPLDQGRQALRALLDGKPWVKAEDAQVLSRADRTARRRRHRPERPEHRDSNGFLVVGGEKVDESACGDIRNVTMSPDGKRYAAECQTTTNTCFVVVDGRKDPEYTPDGRHLLWMELDGPKNRATLFVDGRSCAELDAGTLIQPNARSWEIDEGGVLTVLGQDGDKMKRLRITPSVDASIDTLLASASSTAAGQPAK